MIPKAIILTIGSEILLGDLLDTNAAWLSRELVGLGIEPVAHETAGDAVGPLAEALRRALGAADLVVTTGGLGPTADDTTRQAAAQASGRPLELRPELLEQISRRFASRGRAMGDNNRRQAFIPSGAQALPNPVGTAPGFVLAPEGGAALVCLPGVPFEAKHIWRSCVEPFLAERFPARGALAVRVLKCVGAGESDVDRLLGELTAGTATVTLSFQLVGGEIHLRLVGQGVSREAASKAAAPLEEAVRARLGRLLYGSDDDTLARIVIGLLADKGETLAAAEGASAGALVSALAAADPGGRAFVGAHVAPDEALWGVLGGPEPGAEPPGGEERALALASLAASRSGASVGLASTGSLSFGGPEPAATYHLAASWGEDRRSKTLKTSGPLHLMSQRACLATLDMLRRLLLGWPEAGP